MIREVTKNPMVSQTELQFCVQTDGSKRHITAHLEVAKRHFKDSQTMRNKMLWSKESKIEHFGLNAKCHI